MHGQLLLRLPSDLAKRVHQLLKHGHLDNVEYRQVGDDPQRFVFVLENKEYPARLVNLPCIIEAHKTCDKKTFFKSGDINQILVVFKTEKELQESREYKNFQGYDCIPHGITPPTRSIISRRFSKTRRYGPFRKEEVSRAENVLSTIITALNKREDEGGKGDHHETNVALGGDISYTYEEVVPFEEYMVNEEHPNGLTIDMDSPILANHPELLTTTEEFDVKVFQDERQRMEARSNEQQKKRSNDSRAAETSHVSTEKIAPNEQLEDLDLLDAELFDIQSDDLLQDDDVDSILNHIE